MLTSYLNSSIAASCSFTAARRRWPFILHFDHHLRRPPRVRANFGSKGGTSRVRDDVGRSKEFPQRSFSRVRDRSGQSVSLSEVVNIIIDIIDELDITG